ncbi:hypothetical protein PCE1_000045 [Barthelona sp. PCE]
MSEATETSQVHIEMPSEAVVEEPKAEVDLETFVTNTVEESQPNAKDEDDEADKITLECLYDFNARTANELSFKKGDHIELLAKHPSGMWKGRLNGRIALFPYNFARKITTESVDLENPNIDPSKVEHRGFLTKQGHFIKSWRRRYFVLKNSEIKYYKSQLDVKEKKTIMLTPKTRVEILTDRARNYLRIDYEYSFLVNTPLQSVYYMYANSEEEMQEWVSKIRKAIPRKE